MDDRINLKRKQLVGNQTIYLRVSFHSLQPELDFHRGLHEWQELFQMLSIPANTDQAQTCISVSATLMSIYSFGTQHFSVVAQRFAVEQIRSLIRLSMWFQSIVNAWCSGFLLARLDSLPPLLHMYQSIMLRCMPCCFVVSWLLHWNQMHTNYQLHSCAD